jgi:hypothetical protein
MDSISVSSEQKEIVDAVVQGNNVCVDAVAGSGKTTTLLFIGNALPHKKIAVVTYNSRLKTETRDKVKAHGLTHMKVHSYHSYGKAYYMDPCLTDTELIKITSTNIAPFVSKKAPEFDIFIIDEAQDMTPIYFKFICKAFRDSKASQLVVLGDHLQCIYDFPQKGADVRFLTLAEKIYEGSTSTTWVKRTLHTSYRITKAMEYFVNDCLLGYPRMKTSEFKQKCQPVKYITGDPFEKVPRHISEEINMLLITKVCKPSDIFILAPSIRSKNEKNPVKLLENELVKQGFPCYVPFSDDEELRDQVIQGKIVFSSMHQSKGLERKYVFVLSFSSTFYFTFRDAMKTVCPPLLYVAATRAMEVLYVCGEDRTNGPLPFLNIDALVSKYIEIIPLSKKKKGETPPSTPPEDVMTLKRVTDLIRFMPEQTVMLIMELCKMRVITPASEKISIDSLIETEEGRTEGVADLNGIAIPTIYEHRFKKTISIQDDIKDKFINSLDTIIDSELKLQMKSALKEPKTPADYLLLANVYSAYISGFLFKIKQIKKYTWLPKKTMEGLLDILTKTVGCENHKEQVFEHTLSLIGYTWRKKTLQLEGRADLIDSTTLWELKCVDSIKADHCIQLALYAWLWQKVEYATKGRRKFCLHNIRTGEVQELTGIENLDYIMESVLDSHFRTMDKLDDEAFIKKVKTDRVDTPVQEPRRMCLIVDD